MIIYIKYMVSARCQMAVGSALAAMELHYGTIGLGEVEILEKLNVEQWATLKKALQESGLELMDDRKAILVERIKQVIIAMVHYAEEQPKTNFSDYLSEKLHYDYTYLSNLFSDVKGITIERYIIAHRIERVKELILYNEMNFTEIAQLLKYSSVCHLSNQFKQVTGLTPSLFKKMKLGRTENLDDV